MKIHIRFTEPDDARDLFDWRTDATTQEYSRQGESFSYESHVAWLRGSLKNPARNLFIAHNDSGEKVGQIRFDREGEMAEVGIGVAPAMRGKGVGTELLRRGCENYLGNWGVTYILAEIKKTNVASMKIFERVGFVLHEDRGDSVHMHLYRD